MLLDHQPWLLTCTLHHKAEIEKWSTAKAMNIKAH